MLDMGFIPDVRKIIGFIPAKRQTLLFSATFSDEVRRLAGEFLRQPRDRRGCRPQQHRRQPDPGALPGRSGAQGGSAAPPDPARQHGPGAGLHAQQDRGEPSGLVPGPARRQHHGHPRRPQPGRAHARSRGLPRPLRQGSRGHGRGFARPRHRGPAVRRQLRTAVASPRTTSIASAEPAGRGPAAPRSRSCRRTRSRSSARVQRLLRKAIPCEVVEEFLPDPDREPSPPHRFDSHSRGRGNSGGRRFNQAGPAYAASGR